MNEAELNSMKQTLQQLEQKVDEVRQDSNEQLEAKNKQEQAYFALYSAAVSHCNAINTALWQIPALALTLLFGVSKIAEKYSGYSFIGMAILLILVFVIVRASYKLLSREKEALNWQRKMRISIERYFKVNKQCDTPITDEPQTSGSTWIVGPEHAEEEWNCYSHYIKEGLPDTLHSGQEKFRLNCFIKAINLGAIFVSLEIIFSHMADNAFQAIVRNIWYAI